MTHSAPPVARPAADLRRRVLAAVSRERLVETAVRLMTEPSPTGSGGRAADALSAVLAEGGFAVERVVAGHPGAPAVVARLDSGRPGRVLQFSGHLDTVHLPFVPPTTDGETLRGSGAADMKAGIAAAVEAMRALKAGGGPAAGSVLLTAYDLHESPWGDGRQLDGLIADGHVGDGVLLPEYLNSCLPVAGRGGLIWNATVRRPGPPVHEVLRPAEPGVIAAAAGLVGRLAELDRKVSAKSHPLAGAESVFVGQVHGGTIYNEFPQECRLEGTRRWLPGTRRAEAEAELLAVFDEVARSTGTTVAAEFRPMKDAFLLDEADPLVAAFRSAHAANGSEPLPVGGKPFVDDGNTFWSEAGVPAITHGPTAGGAHTVDEWVSVDDLVRVAKLYALTALDYCPA